MRRYACECEVMCGGGGGGGGGGLRDSGGVLAFHAPERGVFLGGISRPFEKLLLNMEMSLPGGGEAGSQGWQPKGSLGHLQTFTNSLHTHMYARRHTHTHTCTHADTHTHTCTHADACIKTQFHLST